MRPPLRTGPNRGAGLIIQKLDYFAANKLAARHIMPNTSRLALIRRHTLIAVGLAFVFRILTSIFSYGPQSVDDYSHGLIPTWELLRGLPLDLPLWRSPLLVWTLAPFAALAEVLGIQVSFDIFRVIMVALSIFSLWGIWAMGQYILRNPSFFNIDDRGPVVAATPDMATRLALFPIYMLALHFILSFAVTRAFGESIALTLVIVAILWIEESLDRMSDRRARLQFIAGALLLGLACLYRFQVGVLGVGLAVYLAWTRRWSEFLYLALGGLLAAIVESIKDLAFGRYPLETLYNYFYVNKDGAVDHSIQPWYNTWTTVMLMFLIPFSLPFFKKVTQTIRLERILWGLILFFTFLHSLIPHKEERFLYPILPLVLIILARMWAKAYGSKFEKFFFRPVMGLVLVLGLGVATVSNSQSGEYEPILQADRLQSPVLIWDWDSLLEKSFFRHRLVIDPVEYTIATEWPTEEVLESLRQRSQKLMLVTSNPDRLPRLEAWLQQMPVGFGCGQTQKIQSLADSMLWAANPKYNVRRKPTWLVHCQWVDEARTEH